MGKDRGDKVATSYSPYTGIGGYQAFDMGAWRAKQEEEERRRQEVARKAEEQRILGNERRQRENFKLATADPEGPSRYFQKRAREVGINYAQSRNAQEGAFERYNKYVRQNGQEYAARRLEYVANSWRTRNPDYDGKNLIYTMLLSPYTNEEIDLMFEGAHDVLYKSGYGRMFRQDDIEDLRVDFRNKYSVPERMWNSYQQVFEAQEKAEIPTDPVMGFLILSMLTPIGPAGWAAGGFLKVGAGVLRLAQGLTTASVAIGASQEQLEGMRLKAIEQESTQAETMLATSSAFPGLNPAGALGFFNESNLRNPSMIDQFRQVYQYMNWWNQQPNSREDIIAIQKYFQSVGVGSDLEANGFFDYEWQSDIVDASEESIRAVYELQRLAKETGDAPYWFPINGDPFWVPDEEDIPVSVGAEKTTVARGAVISEKPLAERVDAGGWPAAIAHYELREAEAARLRNENPDVAAFWETWGLPHTKLQAEAFGNKMLRNGWLQMLYGSLLQVPLKAGELVYAAGAALNLAARQHSDPTYQRLLKEAYAYFGAQPFEAIDYFNAKPENMSEGYIRSVAKVGNLKNDPVAQQKIADLDERQTQLISGRYSDDWLLTGRYFWGEDYGKVTQYGIDHPDVVRAFSVGFYAVTGYLNPIGRIYRATFKPVVRGATLAERATNFWQNKRAAKAVERIGGELYHFNQGAATRVMGGQQAADWLTRLYRVAGRKKKDGTTNYRIDPRSEIVRDMATEVVDAVHSGNVHRVREIMDIAEDGFIDEVVNSIRLERMEAASGWAGRVGETVIRNAEIDSVAGRIAARQTRTSDVFSEAQLVNRLDGHLGDIYGRGAAIMPYLESARQSIPSRAPIAFEQAVEHITNDWVRRFVTKFTLGLFKRAPTQEAEFHTLGAAKHMGDAAIAVSQDAAWAASFENRYAAARTDGARRRLIEELDVEYTRRYKTKGSPELGDLLRSGKDLGSAEGQALAPRPEVSWLDAEGRLQTFKVSNPDYLTAYFSKDAQGNVVYKQAAPDTVYAMYAARLHREALWASYNTSHATGLAKAMLTTTNVLYRGPIRTLHKLSTPLRQITVAMGAPLLFQKHAITDTGRTLVEEGPFSIIEAFGLKELSVKGQVLVPRIRSYHARWMEEIFGELPAHVANYVRYVKSKVHASEAQWLSGTRRLVYKAKTIWDPKTNKLIDLHGSADALIRTTRGKAFQAWSRYGREGVRNWLETSEGQLFLADEGWYGLAANGGKQFESGGVKFTNRQTQRNAVDEFIDTMVAKEWERLETALPDIMPALKDMARNDRTVTLAEVERLIKEHPDNNAVVSTPINEWGLWEDATPAGYIVGKAMAANKWNRDVMFDSVFIKHYRRQRKEGVDPVNAAEMAADVAELRVAQVHFDLANALAIEAKHRWLAWFATKHRLYGTYLTKLAIERPQLAAIIPEIREWMEERNKRKGDVGEFDKYDLVFDVGEDTRLSMNLSVYPWFSEFPLESSAALAIERLAYFGLEDVANVGLPKLLYPSPAVFDMNLTRGDALLYTLWDSFVSARDVKDNESLSKWLDSLPADRRTQWSRLISQHRSYAIAEGEDITAYQAFNRARTAAWISQSWQTFKMFSGRVYSDKLPKWFPGYVPMEKLEIQRLLSELSNQTDPAKAKDLIDGSPLLASALNSNMNPVEKEELDHGWLVWNRDYTEFIAKMKSAAANGTFMAEYKDIMDDWKGKRDLLLNPAYPETYNASFAAHYSENRVEEFIKALGLMLPLLDAENVYMTGRHKTEKEKTDYTDKILTPTLTGMLESFYLTNLDKSTMLYQQLYHQYVEVPLAKWTGENPYDLVPYQEQSVARYLARGGITGPYDADHFLELVQNKTFRQWMGKGISANGKAGKSLVMGFLSPLQLEVLGWNREPGTEQGWAEYAIWDWSLEKWRQEQKMRDPETGQEKTLSPSAKAYQDKRAEVMSRVLADLFVRYPSFKDEYEFSQLPLHKRLEKFGVGSGEGKEQKVTGEFLDIVGEMWQELDRTWNQTEKRNGVTSGSQAGGAVVVKYLARVARLAKDNPEWWTMFKGTYPLSKFGFHTSWRPEEYAWLWQDWKNETEETEEEEFPFYEYGGG